MALETLFLFVFLRLSLRRSSPFNFMLCFCRVCEFSCFAHSSDTTVRLLGVGLREHRVAYLLSFFPPAIEIDENTRCCCLRYFYQTGHSYDPTIVNFRQTVSIFRFPPHLIMSRCPLLLRLSFFAFVQFTVINVWKKNHSLFTIPLGIYFCICIQFTLIDSYTNIGWLGANDNYVVEFQAATKRFQHMIQSVQQQQKKKTERNFK